jgi:hypothetical protein
MKADLFVIYALGSIAALFAYVFVGGLVVRLFNACPFVESPIGEASEEIAPAVALWPLLFVLTALLCVGELLAIAYRLSQWRPKRKSTLPGATCMLPAGHLGVHRFTPDDKIGVSFAAEEVKP